MRLPSLLYRLYERKLIRQLAGAPIPHHVGVLLDGNRRWARKAGFTDLVEGHRVGAAHIAHLLDWCRATGIGMVTLWLLSTDNMRRDDEELLPLLEIITDVVDELAEPGQTWKLRIVGSLDLLPEPMAERLSAAELRTADREGLQVNVAVGYGGRQEIVDAIKSMLQARLVDVGDGVDVGDAPSVGTVQRLIDDLDVEAIGEHLYTSGQPDPDLVIRTSGEQRLSGFLLWQSAHSEFWFADAYWPDFRRVDFLRALRDYAARHRRYGE